VIGYTFVPLLPFIEQQALYNQATLTGPAISTTSPVPKTLINPADGTYSAAPVYSTGYTPGAYYVYNYTASPYSYSASYGIWSDVTYTQTFTGGPRNGETTSGGKAKNMTQAFADGTSNTIMFSEQVHSCGGASRAWYQAYGPYQYNYVSGTTTSLYGVVGVKTSINPKACTNTWYYIYSSYQAYLMTTGNSLQMVMGDGHVRSISGSITTPQIRSLLDPGDGGIVPENL
jgi:hypothetical protein